MGKPLSDHRDHNQPLGLRAEIARLKMLLMQETREKFEALGRLDDQSQFHLDALNAEVQALVKEKQKLEKQLSTLSQYAEDLQRKLDRASRPVPYEPLEDETDENKEESEES